MENVVLNGKETSKEIVENLKAHFESHPTTKKLAIISVGDDYGSEVYCNMKKKKAEYPSYRKARERMQELMKAQKNVEMFFADNRSEQEQQQTR